MRGNALGSNGRLCVLTVV